jgi:hypothetical protein
MTFTGAPLSEELEITGSPEATVHLAVEGADDANIVVKLCDVSPDGRSTLVTTGWARVRGGQSRSLEQRVRLWATSYVVQAGHRLRLSVSCSDFPRIWPTRTNPRIRLGTGGRTSSMVRVPSVPRAELPEVNLPVPDPNVKRTPHDIEGVPRWQIVQDPASGSVAVTTGIRSAIRTPGGDGRFEIDRTGRASVTAGRPDSARVEGEATIRLQTPQGAGVTIQSRLRVTHDGQDYHASVTVDGEKIFERDWSSGSTRAADGRMDVADGHRQVKDARARARVRDRAP